MSVMTAPAFVSGAPSGTNPVRTNPVPKIRPEVRRPARGSGRASSPNARRHSGVAAPQLRRPTTVKMQSCTTEAPEWQLTRRGSAVVMIVGILLAVAAMIAIGSTFMTVTSEDYRPASSSAAG